MLSLDSKISLMLMVGFQNTDFRTTLEYYRNNKLGGVCFFRNNLEDPSQIRELTSKFSNILRAIDQEGGFVQRLERSNGYTDYPSAKEVSAQYSLLKAYDLYFQMATELKTAGFNFNLSPVVDISREYLSPIISGKERSFGSDYNKVISYSSEFIKAHNEVGIRTALKHFPGHGSSRTDTHLGFTDISSDWKEEELIPYYYLTKEFPQTAVMVSHVFNNKIDKEYPSSLSFLTINSLLREKIGFAGVVITDDLQMKALSDHYSESTIIKKAIQAGADILLFSNQAFCSPNLPDIVNETIKSCIKSGEITLSRIEESVRRIETFMKL